MPRPGLALVHFNDSCCGSVAELRSIILKARRLADDHAEQERAAAAAKTWLLAQIEKKRRAPSGISRVRRRTHRSSPNASPPSAENPALKSLASVQFSHRAGSRPRGDDRAGGRFPVHRGARRCRWPGAQGSDVVTLLRSAWRDRSRQRHPAGGERLSDRWRQLPLIVISHGRGGSFVGHHDIAETLADAGFVAAAINHPGDTASDLSRSDDLSVFIERPNDIKRLVDFMIGASPAASNIDPDRIGFFGFSRGGYQGLVLVGAKPNRATAASSCSNPRPASASRSAPRNTRSHPSRMTRASRPSSSPTRLP